MEGTVIELETPVVSGHLHGEDHRMRGPQHTIRILQEIL